MNGFPGSGPQNQHRPGHAGRREGGHGQQEEGVAVHGNTLLHTPHSLEQRVIIYHLGSEERPAAKMFSLEGNFE